jgi:spore coat protein CotH
MGVPASRSSFAIVYINDVLWGLYTMVESIDGKFLKERFGDKKGNMYKCSFGDLKYLGDNPEIYR